MNQEQLRKEARAASITRSNELWDSPCVERAHFQVGFQEGAEFEAEREKWISVDDALPERGVCVLVYIDNGVITCAHSSIKDNTKTWELYGDMQAIFDIKYQQVTHWQLLPSPPKTSK